MPIESAKALSGFLIVAGAAIHYFLTIDKETVPEDVRPHTVLWGVGAAISILGALLAPSLVTIVLAVVAAVTGGFLIWLVGQRRVPDGELIVDVGDALPELVAPNQDGEIINLADLRGQRVLLKFFRGSW